MNMKKLYFLNEEESTRILNLHKESTKRQYLTEAQVSVSSTSTSITLLTSAEAESVGTDSSNWDENALILLTGTIFKILDKNNLISQTVCYKLDGVQEENDGTCQGKSKIRYNCSSENLKIVNQSMSFTTGDWDLNIKQQFRNLCTKAKSWVAPAPAPAPAPDLNVVETKLTTEADFAERLPCISKAKGFKLMTSGNGNVYFQDNNWKYWADGEKQPINSELSGEWTKFTCNDVQFKPKYKKPSIVPALNKEIQTSIGVATPTGKLTNADYDAILAKLQ
jgi:hypothetical protein